MLLMVVDHARDFFTSTPFSATDPDRASAALFFTRWLTHFCAPTFMLLAGVGAGIAKARGRHAIALSKFLLTRGAWMLVLEVTLVRFGWSFNVDYRSTTGQVIWALGWCMIALAGLSLLPRAAVVAIGVALVAGHNLLDRFDASPGTPWKLLHAGGSIVLAENHSFYAAYPLMPWVGVMALGFVLGLSWQRIAPRRLVFSGAALVALFVVLRVSNVYGDPAPFHARAGLRTLFALLDVQKYPPSLDYLLMTIGPALIALGALRDRALDGVVGRAVVTFGRVPLFFYLLHIPLVHLLTLPLRDARGLPLIAGPFHHGLDVPLPVVYAATAIAIAILWWPCRRWAALKQAHPGGWLSYL